MGRNSYRKVLGESLSHTTMEGCKSGPPSFLSEGTMTKIDTHTPMTVQGIGWMLLRSRNPKELAAYYCEHLGIPELRHWPGGHMLWAGNYTVIETNVLGEDTPDQGVEHPELCDVLPVYAADISSAHDTVVMTIGGRSFPCHQDPDGNWFAVEDFQRSQGKIERLSDGTELSESFAALIGIVYRAPDPDSQRKQFEAVFGTQQLGFDAHFLPGDPRRVPTKTRLDVQRVAIPRVYGFENLSARALAAGWEPRDQLTFQGGQLNYYVDSQGQLMGFQERKPYDPDIKATQMQEDVDARLAFDGVQRAPV